MNTEINKNMGIDVIKLSEAQTEAGSTLPADLARLSFTLHAVPSPAMSIWMMAVRPGENLFPWWNYGRSIDEDAGRLAALTGITSPQGLFDFLYLALLKRHFPKGLYALIPGNVKKDGYASLNDAARSALSRGQNCIYRLEASLGKRVSINWVPFYEPQVMIQDASTDNLARFFNAAKSDDVSNTLSFIALSDMRKMPQVVNLLVQSDEQRSEKMSQLVDWFGVYSSPLDPKYGTCALSYTNSKGSAAAFVAFEKQFSDLVETARKGLAADPTPSAVLRLITRLIAL